MSLAAAELAPIAHRPTLGRLRFFYFDLGNVLLKFDHHLAARQMAEVAGVSEQLVWDTVFGTDLELRYEAGEVTDEQFYEIFCEATGTRPDIKELLLAGSKIFTPNTSIYPVLGGMVAAGYRLGILSNTCPGHWSYCYGGQYTLLNKGFEVYALSYELGACKPSPKIFESAAKLTGCRPEEIFFVDDVAGHVAGAKAAGIDAVLYTTTSQLVADLHARGVKFNY